MVRLLPLRGISWRKFDTRVSIVLYELMTIAETALLARWGPEAGGTR